MKKIRLILAAAAALTYGAASACTNFIVTRGASTDGSVMVTYAADSHALYGALYHTPGGKHKSGAMLPVYEWDTGRYLTDIPQVRETWSTIGNMNEHSPHHRRDDLRRPPRTGGLDGPHGLRVADLHHLAACQNRT